MFFTLSDSAFLRGEAVFGAGKVVGSCAGSFC
jgi:hypothetical protein